MQTQEPSSASPVNPFEPARIMAMAQGLVKTLRNLNERDDEWRGVPMGRKGEMLGYFKKVDLWIKDLARWQAANTPQPPTQAVPEGAAQESLHRSDCIPGPGGRDG